MNLTANSADFGSDGWLNSFKQRVNSDPEMSIIGQRFTTSVSLTFGERRVIFDIEKGKVTNITDERRFDNRSAFGFRAPLGVWHKFVSEQPPPLYHELFAMIMRVPEFVVEGDSLILAQNARATHRFMTLMGGVAA